MVNLQLKHKTRWALNLLVWLIWANIAYNNSTHCTPPQGTMTNGYALHVLCFNMLYFVMAYGNTLWLMPRLLFRKQYLVYFIIFPFYLFAFAIAASHYREWLFLRFPGSDYICFSPMSFSAKLGTPWLSVYLSSFLAMAIMGFTFSIGLLAQKYFEVSKQKEAVQQQQIIAELNLLKSQINPHFLFNVLNSIYSLSLKKSDDTPGIVLKLSEIMRYMLYETRQDSVPLQKEIQLLQDYLDIERIRIGPEHNIQLNLATPITGAIAPALLIPFVENAIKHGTDSMLSDAFIFIDIRIENNILIFNCKNNYKLANSAGRIGGIGLDNVRKRLNLLYNGNHQLHITDESGIFEVLLKINLKK